MIIKLTNLEIRQALIEKNISQISLAKELGITPVYLSRMLSKPLSEKNKKRIIGGICRLDGDDSEDTGSELARILSELYIILKQMIEKGE